MASNGKYCLGLLPRPATGTRAAAWRIAKWATRENITISFLGGDPTLRRAVQAAAEQWLAPGLARLSFEFRNDTNNTDIRIAFQLGAGSWSRIGTTCRSTPKHLPTMNFGWLTSASSKVEIEEVVLHEFGHALGLIHEHQNPSGGILWNRPAVYEELSGPPNGWSKDQIDFNMFEPWEANETNFTETDAESIMMYPIPPEWTLDGFTAGMNTTLSKRDREFIASEYP